METKFPITQKEFKEFLASRKALKFEGNNHCPIAAAINHKINRGKKPGERRSINVGDAETIIGFSWDGRIPNPAWAKRFIARFDAKVEGSDARRDVIGNISNKEQLRIAKSVANVA